MAYILVVEDEPALLQQIAAQLTKAGHTVATALDGGDALKLLGLDGAIPEHLPDAMIMDIMLPNINGYAVCTKMKEDPKTKALPIVVISGFSDVKEIFAKFPNIAAFLSKPFDNKKLANALADVLSDLAAKRRAAAA